MPTNFGILQPLQQQAQPLMGKAPELPQQPGGDESGGDLGSLFEGLSGLLNKAAPSTSTGNLGNTISTQSPDAQTPNPNQQNQPSGMNANSSEALFGLAKQHLGQNELKDAPVLMSFFQKSGVQVDPQKTPWCAGFANAIIQSGGGKGTGSLAAKSFLNWGQPVDKPTPGDVVVLNRGNDPAKGHVGFYSGTNPDGTINVLGGNQGSRGEVSTESFDPSRVVGYRRPPTGQQVQQSIVPDAHEQLPQVMAGIAHVESPGEKNPYALVGPATRHGDQALGKYQIMNSNLAGWSKEAVGRKVSRQEFLSNPQLQEQIAGYQLNKSLKAGNSPQDTASIWFSGRPAGKAGHAHDSFGTTVPQYIKKFNEGAGFKSSMNNAQDFYTGRAGNQGMQEDTRMKMFNGDPSIDDRHQTSPGMLAPLDPANGPYMQTANSQNPNTPPNIPMFNGQKPIRDLSPEEQAALMRWQQNGGRGFLG